MKGKRLSITVHGAYGESNFGDDLLMLGFENYFRQEFPDAQLNFSGQPSDYPKRLLNKATEYRNFNFPKDVLVYGGGTQFFSFDAPGSFSTRLLKLIFQPSRLIKAISRRLKNRGRQENHYEKVSFLGMGIGPFVSEQSAMQTKSLLGKNIFLGVRDEVSYKYCEDWGLNAILGADIIFSSFFNLPQLVSAVEKVECKKRIGVIVRDWVWKNNKKSYLDVLLKLMEEKLDVEYEFIIFAPSKDPDCLALLKNFKTVLWNPEKSSPDEFISVLNHYDVLISARYHGAIIGALLGKPVICVEIEPKLKILTTQVSDLLLWDSKFDINELKDVIERALSCKTINYANDLRGLKDRSDDMLIKFKNILS